MSARSVWCRLFTVRQTNVSITFTFKPLKGVGPTRKKLTPSSSQSILVTDLIFAHVYITNKPLGGVFVSGPSLPQSVLAAVAFCGYCAQTCTNEPPASGGEQTQEFLIEPGDSAP